MDVRREKWIGKASFWLVKPQPKAGYEYQFGRLTRVKDGTRPKNIYVEQWRSMSPKLQKQAIEVED